MLFLNIFDATTVRLSWLPSLGMQSFFLFWEQGWHRGESTRLPPMWPGFESRRRHHMWVEFCCWFSPLLREVFLQALRFSPLLKTNISKFQFNQESTSMWMCYLQIALYLFNRFFFSLSLSLSSFYNLSIPAEYLCLITSTAVNQFAELNAV